MESLYPDIPRFYTAIAQWCMCLLYIGILKRRFSKFKTCILGGIFLMIQIVFLVLTENVPLEYWLVCMIISAAFMCVFIYLSCTSTPLQAVYCCACAFLLSEFLASMEWQFLLFLKNHNLYIHGMEHFIFAFIYVAVFIIGYLIERELLKKDFFDEISLWEIISTIALVIITFAFSNISFLLSEEAFNNAFRLNIFKMRTIIDFSGIAILYAFQSRVSDYISKKELASINAMLKSQYENYRNYQEIMEQIRIQRHDLKHHIALLRGETDILKRENRLNTLEQELDSTDYIDPTGNSVLDVMLSSKQPLMKKNKINFTCVADGALLNFMHVTDICTVIGNALDNAIESVVMIEDFEKRIIHFSLSKKKQFIFLQIRNYCENPPLWNGKSLITTKKDKKNHGYGIKSIKYSIKKYGGNITVSIKDNWFELGILIPENV